MHMLIRTNAEIINNKNQQDMSFKTYSADWSYEKTLFNNVYKETITRFENYYKCKAKVVSTHGKNDVINWNFGGFTLEFWNYKVYCTYYFFNDFKLLHK